MLEHICYRYIRKSFALRPLWKIALYVYITNYSLGNTDRNSKRKVKKNNA